MKKLIRSRKGFTLVEIVLVVAIIVILAGAAFAGISMLDRANKNADRVALHAGCWYVNADDEAAAWQDKHPGKDPSERYNFLNGHWVKVVDKGTEGAQYYSDWDDMYEQVRNINAVTPVPQGGGYHSGGDPIGPGTGGSGSGGSGSAGHHTQSASDMLKDFLDHYGILYTENGGTITWDHDGDYGGQGFSDAWNQWKKDHANSTGSGSSGGSSSGGNNVSTGGSGSGSSGSGSGSTGGSSSSGSGSSGSSGSGSESTGSGAITVPKTVNSGTGVKQYTDNADGTTTATLILNTYNTGDVKFRTNSDGTHSIYCVGNDGKTVVGNVINYTADNQWCAADTWIKLTPGDWNKLSTTYGFS